MRLSRLLLIMAALPLVFAIELRPQDAEPKPELPKAAPTQNGASQTGRPNVRSIARLVIVDVVVSDDGKPVKGLQRGVFHVLEDGHEQTIKVFEEHNSLDPSQIEVIPPLPANTYGNFPESTVTTAANVLLLDALNTPTKDQAYARQQMLEYLRNIPAGRRIAIFALASRLRIVQGFTTDRTVLLAALSNQRNGPSESPLLADPNDETLTTLNNGMQDAGASSQVMASLQQFQADEAAFQMDLRVGMTLEALNQVAGYLGGIPGRKNLIWFSGSFPITLEPDETLSNEFSAERAYSAQLKETSDLLAASRVAVYPVDARGLMPSAVFDSSKTARNYSGVAHGSGSASYGPGSTSSSPGFPGGGGAARRARQQMGQSNGTNPNSFGTDNKKFIQTTADEHASMQQIAEQTGGQAYYDINGIKAAVASAIENGENYYTLAYTPSDPNFDGRLRRIQVKLTDQTHHLAYREGYFADALTNDSSTGPLNANSGAIRRGAPPSSQILFKVRVLPSDDPALKGLQSQAGPAGLMARKLQGPVRRYWIDYAADMHQVTPSLGSDGLHHLSLEFVALAYDHDGKILNVANRTFKLNLQPTQYDQVIKTGMPLHQEIDVPTGEVYLRIAVHDLSSDRVGSIEIALPASENAGHKS